MLSQYILVILGLAFCVAVVYGGISDVTTYTIPNWVPMVLLAGFVAVAVVNHDRISLIPHILIALGMFVICFLFWRLRWLGGGDLKFLTAISLWMGPTEILPFLFVLSGLAAILGLTLIWLRGWSPHIQEGHWPKILKKMVSKAEDHALPYGLPIAIAALVVAPNIVWSG